MTTLFPQDPNGNEAEESYEAPQEQTHICFGGGITLLHEDWYISAWGNGMTKVGFRALCKMLNLPMVEHGKSRYVDTTEYLIALKAVTRLGGGDVFIPACVSRAKNRVPETARQKVTREETEANYETIVRELRLGLGLEEPLRTNAICKATQNARANLIRHLGSSVSSERGRREGQQPHVSRG